MPSLILLRGLPGAGKSTLAGVLSENQHWPVFSIDAYFTDPLTAAYEFRFAENHLAYKQCEQYTEQAMQQQVEKIILDNAFTLDWELEPYFKLAATYNYRLFVLTVENHHGSQNIHGIPEDQIQKMASKYKVKLF